MTCLDEDTVLAFIDGLLDPAAIARLEAHARSCPVCRDLLSAAVAVQKSGEQQTARIRGAGGQEVSGTTIGAPGEPAVEEGTFARGMAMGRYVVLGLIGRGGMGEVYAAYDRELDRKIALKLLHTNGEGAGHRARGRLLREAKAIARLSHPNVVVVYDGGTYEDRVFVAMEFIDGQTLAAWLGERPRGRAEILTVFAAAARGLGAAHAAGLVHRDFKPHNVMVGGDGSVRVTDFGLARQIESGSEAGSEGGSEPSSGERDATTSGAAIARSGGSLSELTLTRTGELLGTPLYMAPEQFAAGRTDAKTDQFSFCVALYGALHGAHPFRHETLKELMGDVCGGSVRPPPAKSNVPAWLRRVLLRGLSVDPAARWPSMDALLTALGRDPARARRRWSVGVAVAVFACAGAFGLLRVGRRAEHMCQAGGARLVGAWEAGGSGPRHDTVRGAFLGTGLPYATETWDRVAQVLDRYVAGWLAQYRDACEATHLRGEQSADVLDLRMACLGQKVTGIRALVDVLASADRDTVNSAVNAANALPPLEGCADVKLLRAPIEPPRDETTRRRIEDLRDRVAVTEALNNTGKHQRAMAEGQRLISEARALGYRPLLAEMLGRVGQVEAGPNGATFAPDAVRDLEESVWAALASRRDDVAAESAAVLTGMVGVRQARHVDGERWGQMADAILDRLGDGHDRLRAWVVQSRSGMREQANDLVGAIDLVRRARTLKGKVLPADSPDLASSLVSEAWMVHRQGDDKQALAINDRAQDVFTRAYGPNSSDLALILSNRGEYLVALGRLDEAAGAFRGALARWEAQLGSENPLLGHPLTGLGMAHLTAGRATEAIPPLERALRLRDAHEPDPALVAETQFALARALWDAGTDRTRARRLAEQARDTYSRDRARVSDAGEISSWLTVHVKGS